MRFRREHGHLRVPVGYRADGINLYAWLNDQRQAHRRRGLAPERAAPLTALGIDWYPQARAASLRPDLWERGYAAAERFYRREGHLRPRPGHLEGGVRLHLWVVAQFAARRNGSLSGQRVARLDAVGMAWGPRTAGTAGAGARGTGR